MTVIVGIQTPEGVSLACDSASTTEDLQQNLRTDKKLFRVGPFLIAGSGSPRAIQLLRFGSSTNSLAGLVPSSDPFEFMVREFVPQMRVVLKDGGFLTVKDETESIDAEFLVAFGRELFAIGDDFQVERSNESYAACGCGADLALGSLFSTSHLPTEERLTLALEAAERFSAGVRRPWVFATTTDQSPVLSPVTRG